MYCNKIFPPKHCSRVYILLDWRLQYEKPNMVCSGKMDRLHFWNTFEFAKFGNLVTKYRETENISV